jgi:hypothetical protein
MGITYRGLALNPKEVTFTFDATDPGFNSLMSGLVTNRRRMVLTRPSGWKEPVFKRGNTVEVEMVFGTLAQRFVGRVSRRRLQKLWLEGTLS